MAAYRPAGLPVYAFRPLSGKHKMKHELCVLGVFAVKIIPVILELLIDLIFKASFWKYKAKELIKKMG